MQAITTPTLTRYRSYLQTVQRQKPASVNRSLISLKRYFGWAIQYHLVGYDPSAAVKLVGEEESAPRHLDDQEEQALVAAVTKAGTLRDRVLIVRLDAAYWGLRLIAWIHAVLGALAVIPWNRHSSEESLLFTSYLDQRRTRETQWHRALRGDAFFSSFISNALPCVAGPRLPHRLP